jgi:hypothetical protein
VAVTQRQAPRRWRWDMGGGRCPALLARGVGGGARPVRSPRRRVGCRGRVVAGSSCVWCPGREEDPRPPAQCPVAWAGGGARGVPGPVPDPAAGGRGPVPRGGGPRHTRHTARRTRQRVHAPPLGAGWSVVRTGCPARERLRRPWPGRPLWGGMSGGAPPRAWSSVQPVAAVAGERWRRGLCGRPSVFGRRQGAAGAGGLPRQRGGGRCSAV